MAVPTRDEAARILLELDPPSWLLRHSAAVAGVASFLAARIEAGGTKLDRELVDAAALLHDVGKLLPSAREPNPPDHAEAGAAWLAQRGHPELAPAVAGHTATLLTDESRYPRWSASATLEERLVAYADKRAGQDLLALRERFAEWLRRHPDQKQQLIAGRSRAEQLEREVCELAGITPDEVRRLPWAEALLPVGTSR